MAKIYYKIEAYYPALDLCNIALRTSKNNLITADLYYLRHLIFEKTGYSEKCRQDYKTLLDIDSNYCGSGFFTQVI